MLEAASKETLINGDSSLYQEKEKKKYLSSSLEEVVLDFEPDLEEVAGELGIHPSQLCAVAFWHFLTRCPALKYEILAEYFQQLSDEHSPSLDEVSLDEE